MSLEVDDLIRTKKKLELLQTHLRDYNVRVTEVDALYRKSDIRAKQQQIDGDIATCALLYRDLSENDFQKITSYCQDLANLAKSEYNQRGNMEYYAVLISVVVSFVVWYIFADTQVGDFLPFLVFFCVYAPIVYFGGTKLGADVLDEERGFLKFQQWYVDQSDIMSKILTPLSKKELIDDQVIGRLCDKDIVAMYYLLDEESQEEKKKNASFFRDWYGGGKTKVK